MPCLIDTHCHLLPLEGKKTLNDSVDMARIAKMDGVGVIACTSHIRLPFYDYRYNDLKTSMDGLQKVLDEQHIDIKLVLGAENYVSFSTISKLHDGSFVSYNQGKYILVEFSLWKNTRDDPTRFLSEFKKAGYIPVIAHVERYEWTQADYGLIKIWKAMGCLMQVNRTSIFGYDTSSAKKLAFQMMENDDVDIIASDAHAPYAPRISKLGDSYRYIESHYGKEKADRFFILNPQKILNL